MSSIELIVYVLSGVFALGIDILCYYHLTKEKPKISIFNVVCVVLSATLLVVANMTSYNTIKLIMSLFSRIILLKLFYKISNYKAFFYTLIFWTLLVIIEIIATIFITSLNITSPEEFITQHFGLKMIFTFSMCIIQYLIVLIPFVKKAINFGYEKTSQISFNTSLFALIICCMTLLAILNTLNMDRMGSHYIVLSIAVILFGLILAIMFLIFKQHKLNEINKKIIENNSTFIEMADDYATLRHNIINQFLAIKSISNKKAQKLIDDTIKEYETQYKVITNVHKIPKGLQGIIYQKIKQVDDKDIKVSVVNSLKKDPFATMRAKTYNNLCEALSILVDNAIEGAISSYDKVIYIEFEKIKETNEYKISIINTFSGNLDLDRLGSKNYTTKKTGHGIGLYHILKNPNLSISNKIINNLYKAELKIKDASK